MTTILDIICNILEKFLITASKGVLDIKYKKKQHKSREFSGF